ncbi:MAG: benzoyl-CoA 2,3-epoxidase subunit BoxB [Rhodospirillales bacterium]|nr:benzoyl-CoA 2,3-epoxidase subunit BoxB [Rhodospirillales bacterium]
MSKIDYSQKIPNNVDLFDDRRLQRALENWQPAYLDWWNELGPVESHDYEVFLRTAIDVSAKGWAHFDMVRMPDYRWGIFLADKEEDRKVNFGAHKGEAAWQEVPGEYRAELRRLIVTQGDTEPASVEQQRALGRTCPSLYDLRSLFQVNVEEGRHLWAMVYLLHAYFGRDGREEAEEMLQRHSGDVDKPRILEAFNIPTTDWLSFFCFTYFQDRDGKFQLSALAESGFDPLSRTCNFMLTEEAHHMFVGETGVGRVVQRSAELVKEHDTMDIAQYGGIPLALIQKWMNFHFSVCLDLFGQEKSTNAANFYNMGLKGRFQEMKIDDDHQLDNDVYKVPEINGSGIIHTDISALTAINERLRDDYRDDCQRGVDRWNKTLTEAGIDFTLTLPHQAFHRNIGTFADINVDLEGNIISPEEWVANVGNWLPNDEDRAFVESLMVPVTEPGKLAGWIAAPARGIQGKDPDFEYIKFH